MNWIKNTPDTPKPDGLCLIRWRRWDSDIGHFVARYQATPKQWHDFRMFVDDSSVTHFAPIKPPEGER